MQTTHANTKVRTRMAFFYALVTGIVIFLPFLVFDKGLFIYYGDFNVQQIPFYQLAHDAIRSGNIGWSWYTDLGANFLGSYSFYLLFSPFFWLTLLFPTAALPYLMAPLLVLKTACAALTSFLFLRRFVRDQHFAVLGSLLYAFSGWMSFNIFFNHFHEVAVFFPLLLLGLEKLVTEDKKGLFAAAVALNAVVNYWFFVGEAVFVILYVLVRAKTDKSWGMTLRKFLYVSLEAVLGFVCAAFAVMPSVLALLGNPRTSADELLSGWNMWLYWHEQRPPAILHSLLFPPELPARPNFFPDHGAKWASLSGWLPLFSITGVLAYFFRRKKDWVKNVLIFSLVFAMVPLLNSLFVLLNDSYYARWFYMPVLLMALATARALEDAGPAYGPRATEDFSRAVRWTAIAIVVVILICGLTPHFNEEGERLIGLADDPRMMWIYTAIAAVCLAGVAVLVLRLRSHPRFTALALAGVLAVSAAFNIFYLANGKLNRERSQWLIDHAINAQDAITLPEEPFARIDLYNTTDNLAMYWKQPSIQAFHSIVPPSIMEFYPAVGVTRDVGSRPEPDYYALRPLLSVRWLFIEDDDEEQDPMPGYTYHDTQNGFNVYENDNYLEMGFSYDYYLTPDEMEPVIKANRSNLMLRAVVLDEEAAERVEHLVQPLEKDGYTDLGADTMPADVQERRETAAESFSIDRGGFTVTTNYETPRLLFLSVPWEEGWSASLESEKSEPPLQIEKANIGFMAVQVPAGPATIRFDYTTPGLFPGVLISIGGLLLLLGYRFLAGKDPTPAPLLADVNAELVRGNTVTLTEEEYRDAYGNASERKKHMQETLNEMSANYIADTLPDTEQTLPFSPSTKTATPPPPKSEPKRKPAPRAPEEDTDASRQSLGFGNIRNATPSASIIARDASHLAAGGSLETARGETATSPKEKKATPPPDTPKKTEPQARPKPTRPKKVPKPAKNTPTYDPLGLRSVPLPEEDPLILESDPLLDDDLLLDTDFPPIDSTLPELDSLRYDPLNLSGDPLLPEEDLSDFAALDPLDPIPLDPIPLDPLPLDGDLFPLGSDILADDTMIFPDDDENMDG